MFKKVLITTNKFLYVYLIIPKLKTTVYQILQLNKGNYSTNLIVFDCINLSLLFFLLYNKI